MAMMMKITATTMTMTVAAATDEASEAGDADDLHPCLPPHRGPLHPHHRRPRVAKGASDEVTGGAEIEVAAGKGGHRRSGRARAEIAAENENETNAIMAAAAVDKISIRPIQKSSLDTTAKTLATITTISTTTETFHIIHSNILIIIRQIILNEEVRIMVETIKGSSGMVVVLQAVAIGSKKPIFMGIRHLRDIRAVRIQAGTAMGPDPVLDPVVVEVLLRGMMVVHNSSSNILRTLMDHTGCTARHRPVRTGRSMAVVLLLRSMAVISSTTAECRHLITSTDQRRHICKGVP
mmetsp:Transcript_19985/g.56639  ORF Transcript_19985/g.56639 Transcript_19985/m.56639 type:complete len:293 (-) Transcript_19985:860-1738(-)